MVMTMFENLSANHPVRKLLEPQSSYLIPFDDVLLLGWGSLAEAPPTSIATGRQFLELIDLYAKTRQFFDDDPTTTLELLGVTESDFTIQEPWDRYPIVGDLLAIWNATSRYVDTYVDQAYSTDRDVQRDPQLQRWIVASGREDGGNVRGLPAMDSKDALNRVLHSLVYRITAHGGSRMYRSANPALTFVANFPPCLQDATIPDPIVSFDTPALLRYLPKTGTIGSMLRFYFIFWASPPYVPFVPIGGIETELFFDDAVSNEALVELRRFIAGFIERLEPETPQIWQWERKIEL
jgi:lipoxygenase